MKPFLRQIPSSLYLGRGVFTTARYTQNVIEYLPEHIERLYTHAHALGFFVDREYIQRELQNIRIELDTAKVKIIAVENDTKTLYDIQISEIPTYPNIIKLRIHPEAYCSPTAHLKTISYLDKIWLRQLAESEGYFDSVLCDAGGLVMETTRANLFWIQGNILYYPDPQLPYLFGITLQTVIKNSKIKAQAVRVRPDEIPNDAQIFICNCLMGIRKVAAINLSVHLD